MISRTHVISFIAIHVPSQNRLQPSSSNVIIIRTYPQLAQNLFVLKSRTSISRKRRCAKISTLSTYLRNCRRREESQRELTATLRSKERTHPFSVKDLLISSFQAHILEHEPFQFRYGSLCIKCTRTNMVERESDRSGDCVRCSPRTRFPR